MKHFPIILFLFASIIGCNKEKQMAQPEQEQKKLDVMKAQITNDWRVTKMTFVKPDSLYGRLAGIYCIEKDTFSFKANYQYKFNTDTSYCWPSNNVEGIWRLPNRDSLFVDYNPGTTWASDEYQKIKLVMVSVDTMKWHITTYSTTDSSKIEYTLVPIK